MIFFFKKLIAKKEEKREKERIIKLIAELDNLTKKAELIELFANKRIKELELKLSRIEEQFEVFEKIIDSLDPKKRVN
ncbi:MAG: hypothetical protein QMD43_04985 [Thermodesulfovibrio sp.]|nr:hypothetical protein [Thermodesulfovibrio sp.]